MIMLGIVDRERIETMAWLSKSRTLVTAYTIALVLTIVVGEGCSKSTSRLVRQQIKERIIPHFEYLKTTLPDSCPLNPMRDKYKLQEEKVFIESSSKYKCNVCGKLFLSQHYIDMHFDNRHPEFVREDEEAICYADYCDITRCDVVSGQRTADFWDISLCLEDDMKELKDRCEEVMDKCMPEGLSRKDTKELRQRVNHGLCQFLTCKMYWEGPPHQGADTVLMFSILTTFMVVFFIIYYCIAYHYFYTDTFSDLYEDNDAVPIPIKPVRNSELRQRLMDEKLRWEWKNENDKKREDKFKDIFAGQGETS